MATLHSPSGNWGTSVHKSAARLDVGARNTKGQLVNFYRAVDAIVEEFQDEYVKQAERMKDWAFNYMKEKPVWDKGFMANHINIDWSPDRNNFELGWKAEDFMVPQTKYRFYAPYVEWGTSKMEPRYILSKTNQAMGRSVTAAMSKAAKRAAQRYRVR